VIPSTVTRALGAAVVIAVDVNSEGATFITPSSSVIGVLLQSMMVVQKTASNYQLEMSDLVIRPKVGHIRWDEMGRADELMKAGYEVGIESIPKLHELIESVSTDDDPFPEFALD
jgi:predicted acylesterase/phospholipase RssA